MNELLAYQRDYPTLVQTKDPRFIEQMDKVYANALKCAGCNKLRVRDERFCWHCGADSEDMFGRILDANLDKIEPVEIDRFATTKERAAAARKVAKQILGPDAKKVSVRMARGSSYIHVIFPNAHEWGEAGYGECPARELREDGTLRGMHACSYCKRRYAAVHRFEQILVKAISGTENRSDVQTDYFDFTWIVM